VIAPCRFLGPCRAHLVPAVRTCIALGALSLGALFLSALFLGCGGDKGTTPDDPEGRLTLKFSYSIDDAPLVMNTADYPYENAAGNEYKVVGLKHYITGVQLRRLNGTSFESTDVHLLNAADPTTLAFTIGQIPAGPYSSIQILVGVDDTRNVEGGLPATLDNFNMQWPRQLGGGYHNVMAEGRYKAGAADSTWTVHLGKVKHDPNDTVYHNHVVEVVVPGSGISFSDDSWEVSIDVNLNQWFVTPTVYDFATYGSFIMDQHEPQEILIANARDAFTVKSKVRL